MKRVSIFRRQKFEISNVKARVGFEVLTAAVLLGYNAV
jgi:hypothetical protein